MTCFFASIGLSQPDRSAPAIVELREISSLGQLVPHRFSLAVYSRPLSLEYPVIPSGLAE